MKSHRQLILGSSSPARRALLARLPLAFITASPNIDETPQPNEDALALVKRLAFEKAQKIAEQYPQALIIAADQVGTLDDVLLNKPLSHDNAVSQLQSVSGNTVRFYTGMMLLDAKSKQHEIAVETYDVEFRTLTDEMITRYLQLEEALHCAGSFQAEGLGIALIHRFHGDDYTTLIGLPLIRLVEMLKNSGIDVLQR